MKLYLHCAEQQRCFSNITECCACHAKWLSWLIRITYETLFTMRGATEMSLQHHQILRLPRKVTLIIDPLHTWNVIYNARSNKSQPPTSANFSKYCTCHEKWISWLILLTNETLFTMRGATCVIVQTHQIVRLPRKMTPMTDPCHTWNVIYNAQSNMCHSPNSPNTAPATKMTVQNLREIGWKRMKRHLQCAADPTMIREWSDHDPRMIRPWSDHETISPQPASQPRLLFTPTTSILYWKIQHFALRLSFQISPNTAPATKSDTWTSPNTAPATKSNTHHWQCAEQRESASNFGKYCACHAKWISWLILLTNERLFTMRAATCVIPSYPLHRVG